MDDDFEQYAKILHLKMAGLKKTIWQRKKEYFMSLQSSEETVANYFYKINLE